MSSKQKKTPAKSTAAAKKPAKAAPVAEKGGKKKDWKATHKHLFPSEKRDHRIGRSILPTRDLTRFVKWPRYIRLQRQRAILKKRLKIPPAINQFATTLDKNQASTLFRLLAYYRPETPEEKKKRLVDTAAQETKGQPQDAGKKPRVLKFGINHITQLVESRKAKLVIIAHDVDPLELVVWLPALCRRMEVPYCIVKGKARLGHLVHQKTATAVALTEVKREHQPQLDQFVASVRPYYNDAPAGERRKWGGGILGAKAQAVIRAREKERLKELTKQGL